MHAYYLADHSAYLRYLDLAGREPACVYIHGLGAASTADFPEVATAPGLAGRRALLVDLLGFGYRDRPPDFPYSMEAHAGSVAALLDHLGLAGCALIGHSMGGTIAITLAASRPDLVACLVVAEANLDPEVGGMSKEIARSSPEEFVRSGFADYERRLRRAAGRDESAARYAGEWALADARAVHASAVGLLRNTTPSARERLEVLSIPRTYVFGSRSLADADVERLPAAGVQIRVVPNAGHAMMDDNLQAFVDVLVEALQPACPSSPY